MSKKNFGRRHRIMSREFIEIEKENKVVMTFRVGDRLLVTGGITHICTPEPNNPFWEVHYKDGKVVYASGTVLINVEPKKEGKDV